MLLLSAGEKVRRAFLVLCSSGMSDSVRREFEFNPAGTNGYVHVPDQANGLDSRGILIFQPEHRFPSHTTLAGSPPVHAGGTSLNLQRRGFHAEMSRIGVQVSIE